MRDISMISIAFLTVMLITSCATTDVNIKTLKGDDVDFSSYQSFFLLPEPPKDDSDIPTLTKSFPRRVVERAVIRELKLRDYREVKDPDMADMLVAIQFSLKDEERTYTRTDYNYSGTGYNSYRYGHRYRSYYGYRTFPTRSTVVEQYRKGNMIIDLIDRKENALIWEAFAQGKGETELDAIEAKVNRVVAEIFSRYPVVLAEE